MPMLLLLLLLLLLPWLTMMIMVTMSVLHDEASYTLQLAVWPRTARLQRCRCFRANELTSYSDPDARQV